MDWYSGSLAITFTDGKTLTLKSLSFEQAQNALNGLAEHKPVQSAHYHPHTCQLWPLDHARHPITQ